MQESVIRWRCFPFQFQTSANAIRGNSPTGRACWRRRVSSLERHQVFKNASKKTRTFTIGTGLTSVWTASGPPVPNHPLKLFKKKVPREHLPNETRENWNRLVERQAARNMFGNTNPSSSLGAGWWLKNHSNSLSTLSQSIISGNRFEAAIGWGMESYFLVLVRLYCTDCWPKEPPKQVKHWRNLRNKQD